MRSFRTVLPYSRNVSLSKLPRRQTRIACQYSAGGRFPDRRPIRFIGNGPLAGFAVEPCQQAGFGLDRYSPCFTRFKLDAFESEKPHPPLRLPWAGRTI